MKYRIKYTYNTGDSFNNDYGLEGFLELEWKNLNIAKANLKRIEEHYNQYQELDSWRRDDPQKILEVNKNKDWFVSKNRLAAYDPKDEVKTYHRNFAIDEKDIQRIKIQGYEIINLIDESDAKHCIKLKTDDGKDWQIFAPWCGYFETLCNAEIVSEDKDMKINQK